MATELGPIGQMCPRVNGSARALPFTRGHICPMGPSSVAMVSPEEPCLPARLRGGVPAVPAGAGRSGSRRLRTGAAQRLDLDEDPAHLGVRPGYALLDAMHGGVDRLRGQTRSELDLDIEKYVVGAEVHGQHHAEADH